MKYQVKVNLTLPNGELVQAGDESNLKGVSSSRIKILLENNKIELIKEKEAIKKERSRKWQEQN